MAVFLIGIGFTCKKNSRKTFQRLLGRKPRHFCDQVKCSIYPSFSHISWVKICPKMFPFLSKMIHMSADSETPHIVGGIWMKYCTALWQNYLWVGRSSVNASACAACALQPILSIPVAIFLTSPCAECYTNDATFTSFRATLTLRYYFWLKSKKALNAPCHLRDAA